MNLLSKIAKQSIYLPFIFLFLMTNAKSATHYVVGVENIEYLPYFDGSAADNSDYYGFSQKLLTLFAQQHDFKFEFYTLPINRLYKEFIDHHHVDFKYPDNPQWKPSYKASFGDLNEIIYSQPTVVTKTGIASLNKNITIDECISFATVRGFTPQSFKPLMNNENVELIETANVRELIELLLKERVDLPVFRLPDGTVSKNIHQTFRAFMKESELIKCPRTGLNRTLYSLRHTYATFALINDGMDIHALAIQMGTSIGMIERHYSHLTPRLKKDMLTGKRYELSRAEYQEKALK